MPPGSGSGKLAIYKAMGTMCGGEEQAVAGTLTNYMLDSFAWLTQSEYQIAISSAAAILGALSAYDGAAFYQVFYHVIIAIGSACIAKYEMEGNGSQHSDLWEAVVVCEVAFILSLATMHGFEGSQVLFGVAFGIIVAHSSGSWARAADAWFQGVAFLWYSLGALVGGLTFTVWRPMLLCALAPLFGSFFVASGLGTCASRTLAWAAPGRTPGGAADRLPFLPSAAVGWPTAAAQLVGAAHGRGALAGACACSFAALLIKGYGQEDPSWGDRKLFSAVMCLVSYIFLMCITALCDRGPGEDWRWPVCGCALWALLAALSAWRALLTVEDDYIRRSFLAAGHLLPDAWHKARAKTRPPELDEENQPLTGRRWAGDRGFHGSRRGGGRDRDRDGGDRDRDRDSTPRSSSGGGGGRGGRGRRTPRGGGGGGGVGGAGGGGLLRGGLASSTSGLSSASSAGGAGLGFGGRGH